MLDETAAGVFTIAATPFLPDGSLDFDSVDRMIDFYAECGATGLTILGMMGEAGKLSSDESVAMIHRVTARTAMPVVVGVTAAGFAPMTALAHASMDAGAAAVMVAPPRGLQTDDQILSYFRNASQMLGGIPWVLQDFPLATQVQIPTKVIAQLVEDCPSMVMLKHEDWPGLDKITSLRRGSQTGARRISILCGNGGQFLAEEMDRGADGAMTGFAYPEMMTDVIAAHLAGDYERRDALQAAYLPLIRFDSQPGLGLAIRKYILAKRGAIAHDTVRRPGAALSPETLADIERLIAQQTVRLAALA